MVNHTRIEQLSQRSVPREALRMQSEVGLFMLCFLAMHFVYILELKNGQYYIGCTKDLKARLEKHKHHAVPTTSRIRPEELVFYAAFKSSLKAYAFEKYL